MNIYISATTDPSEKGQVEAYIKKLETAGVDFVHFDVMDGVFVPTKKLDANFIKNEIEKFSNFQSVIHLMVNEPLEQIEDYINCNAKYLIIHYEAFKNKKDILLCLKKINASGQISGIALNPETPVSVLNKGILNEVGLIMIMGVKPGKSGQKMIDGTIDKIKEVGKIAPNKFIACDGGINQDNINQVIDAGTDFVSLGSYMKRLIDNGTAKKFLEQF